MVLILSIFFLSSRVSITLFLHLPSVHCLTWTHRYAVSSRASLMGMEMSTEIPIIAVMEGKFNDHICSDIVLLTLWLVIVTRRTKKSTEKRIVKRIETKTARRIKTKSAKKIKTRIVKKTEIDVTGIVEVVVPIGIVAAAAIVKIVAEVVAGKEGEVVALVALETLGKDHAVPKILEEDRAALDLAEIDLVTLVTDGVVARQHRSGKPFQNWLLRNVMLGRSFACSSHSAFVPEISRNFSLPSARYHALKCQ